MNAKFIDPNSFVLLELLKVDDEKPIKQNILLQKLAFLTLLNFEELFKNADFKPHRFGLYSDSLKRTKENSVVIGEITKDKKKGYIISEAGKKNLQEFEREIDPDKLARFKEIAEEIKESFNEFTSDEILAYIYKSFPEYVEPSIKADELDYEKIFLNLYKKGKLGVSIIARLLGWRYDETLEFLKKNTKLLILP